MPRRLTALILTTTALGLLGAAPALAALSDEVSAGRTVAARLHGGQASCASLSSSEFEQLGEYVMDRTVGSRLLHQAMNARMEATMGADNADRMHEALGRRYAGCPRAGTGMMGGGPMMGAGTTSTGGWGAMLGSGYGWMRDGAWRQMTRADWQRAGAYMMGAGWMADPGGGWSTGAVIGLVLGGLALGGLVGYLVLAHRPRTPVP